MDPVFVAVSYFYHRHLGSQKPEETVRESDPPLFF